jgi:exonuclease 3'-5' domain-containing protein 1
MKSQPEPILGVDCEGLTKGRPLCLLQMYFAGKSYLFDLLALNPFDHGLKEVMQSKKIMKIFHDFCEDQSALTNQFNVFCDFVFDTQIAHRVIQQALKKTPKLVNCEDNNISLSKLLQHYIDVTHTKKRVIADQMRDNDSFWERRPLNKDMIQYATQDVLYLPQVYQRMQSEYGHLKIIHQYY